jgi:predicted phosphodiesterase
MNNDLKWMIISDTQIPYQDNRALELIFKVMKSWKPDVIDIAGDVDDQNCYSRYSDGKPDEFLQTYKVSENKEEILKYVFKESSDTKKFYQDIRKTNKNSELFVALGNHDIRVFDYFSKKDPDLLEKISPNSLWALDDLGFDYIYYDELPKKRYGDIHIHHGIAISQNAGESVRKDVENYGVSLIRGHSHRMGTFYKTYELRGDIVRGYEIGHLCDEKSLGMKYTTVHNWQKGFAIGHIENGNYPHIELIQISTDYTCYVDGKKFSA